MNIFINFVCTFRFQDVFAMLEADGIEGLSFPAVDGSKAEQKSEIIKLCKKYTEWAFYQRRLQRTCEIIITVSGWRQ